MVSSEASSAICVSLAGSILSRDDCKLYRNQQKLAALALYKEGVRFRSIGRLLGILYVTTMRWMQSMGDEVKRIMRGELPEN